MQINVLDTLGLISSSFGLWSGAKGGDHVEIIDPKRYKYFRLEFLGDVLVGATTVGSTEPVSYTHLRAHETRHDLVCRLLLEKKNRLTVGCMERRLAYRDVKKFSRKKLPGTVKSNREKAISHTL